MKDYLKLVRWPNLIMLAIVLTLMYFAVEMPVLSMFNLKLEHNIAIYILTTLATVFIAAGGYVVNDYFDTRIDEINRPTKVIVGHSISRDRAALVFQILFAVGVLLGLSCAWLLHSLNLALIYIFIPGMLWFYSSSWKRQFLIGNIIIAICTFVAVFNVGFTVNIALYEQYGDLLYHTPVARAIYSMTYIFAIPALMLTLIREIVKDIEDVEGDRELECHTIPVVCGVKGAKAIVAILSVLSLLGGTYWVMYQTPFENDPVTFQYFLFGIAMPFMAFFYLLGKSSKRRDYHNLSTLLKYIMGVGILYSGFIFYLILLNKK